MRTSITGTSSSTITATSTSNSTINSSTTTTTSSTSSSPTTTTTATSSSSLTTSTTATTTSSRTTSSSTSTSSSSTATTTSSPSITVPETSTTTASSTTSSEPTPSPTDACDTIPEQCGSGGGLTVKYYENSIETQAYGIDARTGGLGPDYYLSLEPLGTGITDTLSVPYFYGADGRRGIYIPAEPAGSNYYPGLTNTFAAITFDANNFTLVFTGYYKAPASGSYTFCADTDNVDNFYMGSVDAFPCSKGNTTKTVPPRARPLVYNYYGRTSRKTCGTRDLVQGYYYPVRSVFGNWGTPSHLKFTVKPPGGEETSMIGDFGYPSNCDS
ncbi:hypothetical protein JDV02_010612 [Purpureocillium takamizusanense]|uniref:PA14 domain-containing protein n=1 Tax=Purpureocillium takamizusanense TaxID=2060973 RepID=A0A9Q8QSL8_9HYPO|nr:uncharacterized protein JDV02_010612 [Purpureocillium takamizusanense]UNI24893.1 hypothetical protein JDV02_010612 [Purpureocillium takamizusanense]